MITKQQKFEIVKGLKEKLNAYSFVVFLNFHGMSVAKMQEFRKLLRKTSSEYVVAKKTLLGVAAKEAGLNLDKKKLEGEIGAVLGGSDEDATLAIAKEISAFEKKNADVLKMIGGFWERRWIDVMEIKRLSSIPSREVLLTQLAFMLNQPTASLARALNKLSEQKGQNH